VLLLAIAGVVDSRIIQLSNLQDVITQATPIAMLALGAMVVLVSGGIDLSAGFGVSLCAVIAGRMLGIEGSLGPALLVVVGAGALLGLVNGLMVGLLGIPPFVATLGSMIVLQGITLLAATGGVLIISNQFLTAIGTEDIGPVPGSVVVTGVVAAIAALLIRRTRFGIRTFGIGSNLEAAQLSGVPVARQQVLVYVFSGIITALTALLVAGRASIVTANIGGLPLLLDAIAASVLGGTSIFGGRGTVSGTLVGALIISLVTNILRVIGVDASSLDFFRGAIILLALVADSGIRLVKLRFGPEAA
jgi:ribose transport system permease protein